MRKNDKRIKYESGVGYFYYTENQRYLMHEETCPECGGSFLSRRSKTRGKIQTFCSVSCRAKQKNPNRQGNKHWNWKGGKTCTSSGYVMSRAGEGGYRLEHCLVMEKKLGRSLTKDETVHHINGIRNDNRVENLELWSSRHPKGQRVVDKIVWAEEILAKYGPEHVVKLSVLSEGETK